MSLDHSALDGRAFDENGFAVVPRVVGPATVAALIDALSTLDEDDSVRARNDRVYAVRNLLSVSPAVRALTADPAVRAVVEPLAGRDAVCVRAILFDKSPGANWKVAWHQDLSIAVRERVDVPGFGPWSTKAGVVHVQPPVALLRRMVTVRLHLDDCGDDNGPLRVLPGSHRDGVLSAEAVEGWRSAGTAVSCRVPAGGAVLMRPLLLHASSSATAPGRRRVVHLEWSADPLPGGLAWDQA